MQGSVKDAHKKIRAEGCRRGSQTAVKPHYGRNGQTVEPTHPHLSSWATVGNAASISGLRQVNPESLFNDVTDLGPMQLNQKMMENSG